MLRQFTQALLLSFAVARKLQQDFVPQSTPSTEAIDEYLDFFRDELE